MIIAYGQQQSQRLYQNEHEQNQFDFAYKIKLMSDKEAMRMTAITQSDAYGTKRRFGLFSQPLSNAIGDDGEYKTKLHPKNQQGKPQTNPRGIYTKPPRSGQLKNSFLGDLNSLAAGEVKDEYIDPDRKLLMIENENFKSGYSKQQMFKPASGFKEIHQPSYDYTQQNNPEKNPKRNRQEDGKVKAQPRNIYTNQQSTVIKSFFKPIKYMEDPYDRAHQMEAEKHKKDKSLEPQSSFKLNHYAKSMFNKDLTVFGTDTDFKPKIVREPKFNIFKHQAKWRTSSPNKNGLYGYFSQFPKYLENPPRQIKRKPKEEGGRQSFRRMSVALSKPSPSIAYNINNLRKTISHSFSHRI